MAALPDRQRLEAAITPRLSDSQGLQASVYSFRVADRQQLQCTLTPRVVSRQLVQATVVSTALRDAAEAVVIAPIADITFL
ncbi:MAG: hypothetical protein ACE149_06820 [Armatimonadota bacterium]